MYVRLLCMVFAFASFSESVTVASDTIMVRLRDAVPMLTFDVRYATANNFAGRVLYSSDTLWARAATAAALHMADSLAREQGLRIKVFDAYRPLSVQRIMWEVVPDERYVANPAKGSRHNRGAALDLTLCDSLGVELDMGTVYDDFTERAHADYSALPEEVKANRSLLRTLMDRAGFDVLPTEWWHYDLRGWERFGILDE
jgi:D-alanyl-D-alanine dipeptidase